MKKIFLLLLSGLYALSGQADQIEFKYDACGNCIRKVKTTVIGTKSKSATMGNRQAAGNEEEACALRQWSDGTELHIYPNPTRGPLNLVFRGTRSDTSCTLRLLDAQGIQMMYREAEAVSCTLDLTAYPAGIYVLQVTCGNETKEWKIIRE